MDIATILPELIKQSVLLFILYVYWNYTKDREAKKDEQMQKKDEAILNMVTDHSAKVLIQSEKEIESRNNLNVTIAKLGDRVDDNHKEVSRDLEDIKKKISPRLVNNRPSATSATAKA